MKTLNDVIREMHKNYINEVSKPEGGISELAEKYMRVACEAMLRLLVPEEEKDKYNHRKSCYCPICCARVSHNAIRADILKRAEKFMGDKK